MIASCGFEVKFHDWGTCNCIGCYLPPSDSLSTSFHEITWCSEGTLLAAVPVAGKSVLVKPHFSSLFRNEQGLVSRENIDIASVKCARFSRTENHLLALGTAAGHVLNYNVINKNANAVIDDLPACVNFIEYGANDTYMVAGCSNGQIFLLQSGVGITASYFVPHSDTLTALAVHSCVPQYFAGGSDKGVVAIWDVNTSCCIMKATQHDGLVSDIAFSPKDDMFTTIGSDQKIHIYDMRTAACVHEKQFDARLTTLAYCPNGNDVAVATDRGYILCLDKRYLKTTRTGLKAHDSPIKKLRFQKETYESALVSPTERASQSSLYAHRDATVTRSEIKLSASGDCSRFRPTTPRASLNRVRPPTILEQTKSNLRNYDTTRTNPREFADLSLFHIIDEASLKRLREEVMTTTRDIINKVLEDMNTEFLKMRMSVSREFCTMEARNKARWEEFNDTLIKLACLDDRRLEEELHDDIHQEIVEAAERDTRLRESQTEMQVISEENTFGEVAGAFSEQTLARDTEMEDTDYMEHDTMNMLTRQTSNMNTGHASSHLTTAHRRKGRFVSRLPRQKTSNPLNGFPDKKSQTHQGNI